MFNHTNQSLITLFYIKKVPFFCQISDDSQFCVKVNILELRTFDVTYESWEPFEFGTITRRRIKR